jgi:hypothetical protein
MVAVMAVAAADARAYARRPDMCACADAAVIKPAACANRPDIGAGVHAAVAHTGAGAHNRSGMAAGGNAVLIDTCARADTADMGARAHAIAADMCADTDTQDFDIRAGRIGRNGREQRQGAKRGGENFHGAVLVGSVDKRTAPEKVPCGYASAASSTITMPTTEAAHTTVRSIGTPAA